MFQSRQAAEKALKGILIFYNADPEKTHNLISLIKEPSKYTELLEEVNKMDREKKSFPAASWVGIKPPHKLKIK
jgi:HEPN domain-containing protein